MLALDSPRWKELSTFFGEPEDIPRMLKEWEKAIGTEKESELWREVYDCVWHQNSIESAAFAVVPHLVEKLETVSAERKIEYVIDLGFVESSAQGWRENEIPSDLIEDYRGAIKRAKKYAVQCLDAATDKVTFRYILGAIASLYSHSKLGDMLFHLDTIAEECPKCGECVYPSEIQESDYI